MMVALAREARSSRPFNMNYKLIFRYNFLNIFNINYMTDVPIIKPINITEYEFKQSKYEHVPK